MRSNYIIGMDVGADCCSDEAIDRCAHKLKVCGHPMRLRLLCRIAVGAEPCVSDLWLCLDQPQPVVSQHLAVLKRYGIVKSRVCGNRRVYSIVDPFVQRLIASLVDTAPVDRVTAELAR